MKYDSRIDTLKHITLVRQSLARMAEWLHDRGEIHDASKLVSPEKEMFDIFRPKPDTMSIESDEYKQVLVDMGEMLKHHYAANSHHPEHFPNGIAGMNLLDVMEMVCDWSAAAGKKGEKVNMQWASGRFGIKPDECLYSIIENTFKLL